MHESVLAIENGPPAKRGIKGDATAFIYSRIIDIYQKKEWSMANLRNTPYDPNARIVCLSH